MPKTRIIPSYLVIVASITNKMNGIVLFEFGDCRYDMYDKIESEKNIVNNNVYKKGIFNGKIAAFYEVCKPYYHLSKRKYLDKKISYNTFITVIRQICNSNKITYTSQIKYDKSVYDIIYSISVPLINLEPLI